MGLVDAKEFRNIQKDITYKKTLVVRRGPISFEYKPFDVSFESSCEFKNSNKTKAATVKIYNVQEDEDTYLLKYVEPCPKVEWAGELNRDRHFIVNTNSHDKENLQVIVFNPNHGQGKFHNMTSDRLQNVFLYYRKVGDLLWSKARTEVTNDDGSPDSLALDFAAEYAYDEESDYGYSSMKWALANKVPEGTYEIRVDAECKETSGGPEDMDLSSTPIISGVIDLTPPEQYGRALPLRDSVLVGEEISVMFTEPVRCEAFDLRVTANLALAVCGQSTKCNAPPQQVPKNSLHAVRCCSEEDMTGIEGWLKNDGCSVWSKSRLLDQRCHRNESYEDAEAICEMNGGRLCTKDELENNCARGGGCCEKNDLVWSSDPVTTLELDRHDPQIQIVCDGRKVGFQIDPAKINVEDWIGLTFTVEMGQMSTASKSNILDMNGNQIGRNVKFTKTFGNIDLSRATTSFTVTLSDIGNCSDVTSEACTNEVKNKIASLLVLSSDDQSRIEVESVSNTGNGTVNAKIKVHPGDTEGSRRMLRRSEVLSNESEPGSDHSVGLFRKLQQIVAEGGQNHGRKLDSEVLSDGTISNLRDMKILPSESDMELLTTDPELIEEEEELYRYGSGSRSDVSAAQPILNKVERQALVEEIDKKSMNREEAAIAREEAMMNDIREESRNREEAMMDKIEKMGDIEDALFRELKESKEKSLQLEFIVLSLACLSISLVAYMSLKR